MDVYKAMSSYEKIYPTRFPLLEFSLAIWRFHIATQVFSPGSATDTYEYLRLMIYWGTKTLFHIRLYDTYKRKSDQLGLIMHNVNYSGDRTKEQLEEIRDIAIKELENMK